MQDIEKDVYKIAISARVRCYYDKMKTFPSEKNAFTLIEILVVITIISILSGILYASFGTAREDARNKSMRTELKEVQLALELYKAQYGRYPAAPTSPTSGGLLACVKNLGGGEYTANSKYCTGPIMLGLEPEFIAEIPSESASANPNCSIIYRTDNDDNSWYKLTALDCYAGATGPSDGVQQDDQLARCPSTCTSSSWCAATAPDFYNSYAVYSKGGECEE